ncbi:inosine/xanthosine triphosphatase [Methanothermococcus okinawensis]|nr:inosine/xanthosine triphosphatase [Methanothermococcus okinawensis]
MFKGKKCEICGAPATTYLFGRFLCGSAKCAEKARLLRGGPAGHKLRVISVGSKNPVKVKAVEMAMEKSIGSTLVVEVDANSGVSKQPIGFDETTEGAKNRAKYAFEAKSSLYGVGIEAGLVEIGRKYLDVHVCAIYDGLDYTIGTSQGFQVPTELVKEMKHGEECGVVAEKIYNIKDIGKKEGIIGYLTNGGINRLNLCESAVLMAMVPRLVSNKDIKF